MNAAVAIATHEVRDRARLFLIAAVVAAVPFLAAMVPGAADNRGMAIALVGGCLALAFPACVAMAMGAKSMASSFYFSKPAPPAAIWLGKVGAALITSASLAALIAIPSIVGSGDEWLPVWRAGGGRFFVAATVASLLVFLIAQHLGTMLRSRSILLALDVALVALTLVAIALIVRPVIVSAGFEMLFGQAPRPTQGLILGMRMLLAIGVSLALVLAIAPLWQLRHGGTDARTSHVALSRFIWSGVAGVIGIAAAFAWWATSAPLARYDVPWPVAQGTNGEWVLVTAGDPLHLQSTFLVNPVTGNAERLNRAWMTTVSRDGSTAAWLAPVEFFPRVGHMRLFVRRTQANASTQATRVIVPRFASFVLSPDGSRVAVAHQLGVRIYDVDSGRFLGSINKVFAHKVFFANRDLVQVIGESEIVHFDLAQKQAKRVAFRHRGLRITASEDGTLLLTSDGRIVDTQTGAVRATTERDGVMLADGTSVIPGVKMLRRYDAQGNVIKEITLPFQPQWVGAQLGASRVMLASPDGLAVVHLDTGAIERKLPRWVMNAGTSDPRIAIYGEGTPLYFMQRDRKLGKA